ncbi:MAG: aldo/keto reductase, partial [Victivallales bacterium]|nr:aldo/keto reductase [Victivallales bacterium]
MSALIQDCSKLGFGLMRLPRQGKEIDIPQTCRMVDDFLAAGGKYFDTAYVYGGSEEATRKALCDRHPRESYCLASKLNASTWAVKTETEAKEEIRHSLARTNAKYFDFYMLHGIDESNLALYNQYGLWSYIKELKAQGLVRHWGFSFHGSPRMLEELLNEHPDAEFVQLQINYIDWEEPGIASRECYETA